MRKIFPFCAAALLAFVSCRKEHQAKEREEANG